MTKTTFLSSIFPILLSFTSWPSLSIVRCANQKLQRKTCNTRVTLACCEPSWMRYLRREEISLLPEEMSSISSLKPTYVPLWIVYCFYSMYFIIGVIVKFLLQQRLQLSSTCLLVAMWTSRAKAVVYVARRRSL